MQLFLVSAEIISCRLDRKYILSSRRGNGIVVPQEIRRWFESVPGLFDIVLRGGYLYGAWPHTVLILIEFKFIISES